MNQVLIDELEELVQRDLATRSKLLEQGRLYGGYDSEMQAVHTQNAQALAQIVAKHGWPGLSEVGLKGSRAAWMIAQHAICTPALQRDFLARLERAVDEGEAPAKQAAMLHDRVRFNEGRPQMYGTVLDWTELGGLGCDVEDPEGLDERRAGVGLPPFADALKEHQDEVAAEGGQAPADFAAYRRRGEDWARQVGWR